MHKDATAERAALLTYTITAESLIEGHRALGVLVKEPALSSITQRLAATRPARLQRQLAHARASRESLSRLAERRSVAMPVRQAVAEYLSCLTAWCEGIHLSSQLAALPPNAAVTSLELGLWSQDDNTGCQTGMLRQADGSVLFWHTEEDTVGYFDQPRVITLCVPDGKLSAFLYPYLLPGPAFGWRQGQVHALDSLHVKQTPAGTVSSVVAWLLWRLAEQVDAAQVIRALAPHADGCAINVLQIKQGKVHARTHEFGGRFLHSRTLPRRRGAHLFQVNTVALTDSELFGIEALTPRARARYDRRVGRTTTMLDEILGARRDDAEPQAILAMMADRRGGSYAYANVDVKAHLVGRISATGMELYVQAGPTLPGDRYEPQWRL